MEVRRGVRCAERRALEYLAYTPDIDARVAAKLLDALGQVRLAIDVRPDPDDDSDGSVH